MKEKQFLLGWISSLIFVYGVGVLWQQHDAIRVEYLISLKKESIHLLDQDITIIEQEVARYKTASYITKALASEEFVQASCHTMMTYS